jgi:hypothetical protein
MRRPFSDHAHLKREARRNVDSGLGRLKRWWAKKYKLPPNHELFRTQTVASLLTEFYEDLYHEKDGLEARLESEDEAASHASLRERVRTLNKILNEQIEAPAADDLIDLWERELAAGSKPDLAMMPGGAVPKESA